MEVIHKVEVGQDHELPSTGDSEWSRSGLSKRSRSMSRSPLQKNTVCNECKQIDHQEYRGHSKSRSRSRSQFAKYRDINEWRRRMSRSPLPKVLFIMNIEKYIIKRTGVIQKAEVGPDHI